MALHLVGETLDKTRSHYLAETGKITQLMRGIYVDAEDDIDAIVFRHAVRIANYLHPQAYLSGASAVLLGPTRDGRLFLSARRNHRTRIRGLEIIQNAAPKSPSIGSAVIKDGMGEFHVNVSSIRQRFLEAFRVRSEHATSIDENMRMTIAARLIEEYDNPKAVADAIWTLARENGWVREGELAERYLQHQASAVPAGNEAALDLIVAWHGAPLGHLTHDGFEWRWRPIAQERPQIIRQTTPGRLPPFILSLLPEGWLENILKEDDRTLLRSGKRYMSNITVVEHAAELAALSPDILLTRLESHTEDGTFTGKYAGPGRGEIETKFEHNLAQIYARADTPRLSGVQIKAPMYLDPDGVLSPSTGKPFTHILKPAGTSGYDAVPLVEWTAMALGRAVGFAVPAAALVAMPDNMPPSLIVERFDIRTDLTDKRMLALEDLCSVLDLPTEAKYDATMERIVRAVRPLSTAPDDDTLIILRRALFAWLIADGDMHLKNMALLKIAQPGESQFRCVRMAPLYDAVTTRVFPNLKHDRMALKLNGKDDKLKRADFRSLAATGGLKTADADAAINDLLQQAASAVGRITLPEGIEHTADARRTVKAMLDVCQIRIKSLA